MSKRLLILLVNAVLMLVIVGCGGNGGDSGNAIPLKTNFIRNMGFGDSWQYTLSGTLTDGSITEHITGTLERQILNTTKQSPINSKLCLDQYSVLTLSTSEGPLVISSHDHFKQDGNG